MPICNLQLETCNLFMLNYFTLLNVPESFTLDDVALQREYVMAQKQSHPDKMIGKSEKERVIAFQHSMDVNDAYEVLKHPLHRAEHLLALNDIFVNTDGSDTVKPDQALLIEIMEMREQLEGCVAQSDAAKCVADIRQALECITEELTDAFEHKNWQNSAQLTIRLRYYTKSLEEAMAMQFRLKGAS